MTCKPYINAINTASQTLTAGAAIGFGSTNVYTGYGVVFNGSNTFTVNRAGFYNVSFDADIDPTATGTVEIVLTNNGVNVPGAVATFDGTASEVVHVHLQGAVKVLTSCKCINNNAVLQVTTSAAATVTNPNIIIDCVKI